MSETGHIIGGPADPAWDGATLTVDVALGDTVLHVDDTADFDEDAGLRDGLVLFDVELDGYGVTSVGSSLRYTTCDDEAGTVTLTAVSTVTASAGDPIYVGNALTGLPVGVVEVMVSIDGSDTTGDPLPANLDLALLASVGVDVDLTDQAAQIDEDEDGQLWITGFLGLAQVTGAVKAMQDQTTAIGSGGSAVLDLTYRPIVNSEHLYWNGVYQPGSEWSRDAWTVTIPDPDGVFEAGDELVMEYLYTDPATAPPLTYGGVAGHLHSGTSGSYPTGFITSTALPSGTATGDLIVVCAIGDGGGGPDLSGDPRLTTVRDGGNRKIAIGKATDLSAIVCHIGGTSFPLNQFAAIEVLTIQGDGSGPLEFDPTRVISVDIAAGGTVPTIGGTGHGVVAAVAGAYATTATIDMATDMPGYTDWGGHIANSVVSNFGFRASEPPPTQTNPTNVTDTLVTLIGLR